MYCPLLETNSNPNQIIVIIVLSQVVIDCPSVGIEQTFPCNQWLADDEGDKRIERTLNEELSRRKTKAKREYNLFCKGHRTLCKIAIKIYIITLYVNYSNQKWQLVREVTYLGLSSSVGGQGRPVTLQSDMTCFILLDRLSRYPLQESCGTLLSTRVTSPTQAPTQRSSSVSMATRASRTSWSLVTIATHSSEGRAIRSKWRRRKWGSRTR